MSLGLQRGALFAGRYRIVRRLGAGAMGSVYEVVHLATERPCALKIMHAHIVEREEMRERFKMEAKVAARVGSEYIVDVLDAGVDEGSGTPFFVMERLKGEDLSRRLKRVGKLEPKEAVRYLHQVSIALDRTHQASIVHRDLKPANLFLTEGPDGQPRVKVLDFGVAKFITEATGGAATAIAGTPLYMSPEQCRGGRVTAAVDIYAFGMIAYTLLVGDAYFADEFAHTSNLVAFALATVNGPVDPASVRAGTHDVQLPKAFDAWFATVTNVDPSRRFATAGDAARALALALDLEPLPDTVPSVPPQTASGTIENEGTAAGDARDALEAAADEDADWAAPTATASFPPGERLGTLRASQLSAEPHVTDTERRRAATTVGVRGKRPLWIWAAAGIAVLATGGGLALRTRRAPPPEPSASPLAPPMSVLACPIFEASGVPEPAGWLGAAAAATVCERARIILGGSASRTLIPAELMSLPAQPVDHFPEDPFGQSDARPRSLEAARRRAVAYIDGKVSKEAAGFRAALTLHRADGSEIARAEGQGRALYEALRSAMNPLVASDRIPMASALDQTYAEWSRAADIESALALLDVELAMGHNSGSLADECAKLASRSLRIGEMAAIEQWRCGYTLGIASPPLVLAPLDESASAAALAARARFEGMAHNVDDPKLTSLLREHFAREGSPLGRSLLAATLSCSIQASDAKEAADLARIAVQIDAKNRLGEFCTPWGQLLLVTTDTASIGGVVNARQAWLPWQAPAWLATARRTDDMRVAIDYARRAHTLAPLNAWVTEVLASKLLANGDREEVRSMAIAIGTEKYPVHRVASAQLLARVDASEARFKGALERARRTMEPEPNDAGWVRVQRFDLAWYALEVGGLLGRSREIADRIVERFLEPEPSPLDGNYLTAPLRIPAVCVRASSTLSKRCFTRFHALRGHLGGGILPETDAFVAGAERFTRGDLVGAAKSWRPLLREPGVFAKALSDEMEAAFERSGDRELVERLESIAMSSSGSEYNGATPADVRAARRAAARGDSARARQLAQKVIEAWSVADETVPAVAEMRKLLTRLH